MAVQSRKVKLIGNNDRLQPNRRILLIWRPPSHRFQPEGRHNLAQYGAAGEVLGREDYLAESLGDGTPFAATSEGGVLSPMPLSLSRFSSQSDGIIKNYRGVSQVMSGTNGSNGATPPNPRAEWITKRREEAARSGDTNMSQMHFARKGLVTEEMVFVAEREKVAPELIRDEVAAGRMIIPANVNHPELEPMCIGVASKCKINANIGNSSVTSNVEEELKKLHTSVHYGADTVMDLSTGGGIHEIREAILR